MISVAVSVLVYSAQPAGPGPFGSIVLSQPVTGAPRGVSAGGWQYGKICDVTQSPYNATGDGKALDTTAIQRAIDDCGDLTDGGTVLLPSGGVYRTGSLWLRSNMTLRIDGNATLLGSTNRSDAPIVYTKRAEGMRDAHAGLINGARCLRRQSDTSDADGADHTSNTVSWDECAKWGKLRDVVIEGGGTIDANANMWLSGGDERPMMLDLLWIDGLTVRDLKVRQPGYWTIHPAFCNNVRVTGMDVFTRGPNTDGLDPDSSWNVYIANNLFDTGDDCVAVKSGRDWDGLQANMSTRNVLIEKNEFREGHGVSIGSETAGWVVGVTVRDSHLNGTNVGVRIKTCAGRGAVQGVVYENMWGDVKTAVSIVLDYCNDKVTNETMRPEISGIFLKNISLQSSSSFLECHGRDDSKLDDVSFDSVNITGRLDSDCSYCSIKSYKSHPTAC
eukprot:Hpha_TRINITY_DN15635_c1_g1::TRINITY_DN15635_c1_g1_i1::g.101864::m.101864